jgi:hypothetical protein
METEKLLEKFKHPEPYIPPSAPGGSWKPFPALIVALSLFSDDQITDQRRFNAGTKFERNLPPPEMARKSSEPRLWPTTFMLTTGESSGLGRYKATVTFGIGGCLEMGEFVHLTLDVKYISGEVVRVEAVGMQ